MKTAAVPPLLSLFFALFIGQNADARLIGYPTGIVSPDGVEADWVSEVVLRYQPLPADQATELFKLDAIITEAQTSHFYDFPHRLYDTETSDRDEPFWGYARLVAIPEPATGALLGVGLLGMLLAGAGCRERASRQHRC
ncbi:PEP-CTERM sorting domain-containing protein [Hydrocarboniclastica marina]|uniref:PEP-CTERM sorting domain-containing protein n=1 Tax=Hydrocarboniclastica marina TaxID=2259620 RepID=A0A4P7XI29_9ALTE|nr:PEP-CTERM sorting domain-containing protein [Hydrocarboniclastica marina]MAL97109.1 hypothetical protein [Alteromonadaceae bacterium]QCF25517.1 PEP-CTERM sorting domain-containing protein [Hydrocarboniclastica marina]|tara:strand:- start:160 stop:576 length:417 start_codon:yes stop_codon:yes gene_type:complete